MSWNLSSSLKKIGCCEKGNILIEVSFALPVLVLLLTAGFDLSRHLLLLNKLEQFVAAQARNLIHHEQVEVGAVGSFRSQGLKIIGFAEDNVRFNLSVEGGALGANGLFRSDWISDAPGNDMACSLSARPAIADLSDPGGARPDFPFLIVRACFDAGADYYLTPLIPDSVRILQARAINYREVLSPMDAGSG